MVGTLGVIMVCMSALSEHCQVLTSPYVFTTMDECKKDTLAESRKIKSIYSHALIVPNCVELKYDGEEA